MLKKAVKFLDEDIVEDYNKLLERASEIRQKANTKKKGLKDEKEYLEKQHISHFQLQWWLSVAPEWLWLYSLALA